MEKITRDKIVAAARAWIGTPWQHQASLKGVATDCVGLIRGVYEDVTGRPVVGSWDYPATWHLFKADERLAGELAAYVQPIDKSEARPGDILTFGFGKGPAHHLGIMATPTTFVHAWADVNNVTETRLSDFWIKNWRGAFRFPEVQD